MFYCRNFWILGESIPYDRLKICNSAFTNHPLTYKTIKLLYMLAQSSKKDYSHFTGNSRNNKHRLICL